MNQTELDHSLRRLRLSGMADTLPTRIVEAQAERVPHVDFLATLVHDEMNRRQDRLIDRRIKKAGFRDHGRTLDNFDFAFNPKMDRKLIFELGSCRFIAQRQDALMLGPPGTGKSHLAQAIGTAAAHQGFHVLYKEAHVLVEELADATLDRRRRDYMKEVAAAQLLIIDDLGMRKLPPTASEDLLEVVMRRHERASTMVTSNRPVDDWGKLLGDNAAVSAMLDRLLHHSHVLKCGPKSWRTRAGLASATE
ncbi:MAG: IS21-like element helper ATPase IstB [Planctomycetota bacterium]